MVKPRAAANEITTVVQKVLGDAAYPVDLDLLVSEYLARRFAPLTFSVVERPLESVEGALLNHPGQSEWIILLNADIEYEGRKRFTFAHELGHFLLHRREGQAKECSADDIDAFGNGSPLELEANEFASQLLLPPNVVRTFADDVPFTIETLRAVAARMNTSLTAAAVACVAISSRPIAFVVVVDGFVSWGRSSDRAFQRGVRMWKGREVPAGLRTALEIPEAYEMEPQVVSGWFFEHACIESGLYGRRLGKSLICLDFHEL